MDRTKDQSLTTREEHPYDYLTSHFRMDMDANRPSPGMDRSLTFKVESPGCGARPNVLSLFRSQSKVRKHSFAVALPQVTAGLLPPRALAVQDAAPGGADPIAFRAGEGTSPAQRG
jgi:hypothetical protein